LAKSLSEFWVLEEGMGLWFEVDILLHYLYDL